MATISAGDLTKLRNKQHKSTFYLSVLQSATLLTATVNGAHDRGDRTLAYASGTGSGFSSITAHQTFEIDTTGGLKKARIRSITGNQTSGTITLDENGIDADNAQAIRVKENYELWGIPPSIREGVFYKIFDITYSDQNSEPGPVAIAGPHRAGFLSSGSITFNLNASSSYAITQGASISSYAWSCTGGTIDDDTAATTTIEFDTAGQYWLKLIVTDSNGHTQETYRAYFVYDADNMPYTDFTISGLSGDWNGGGWQFTVTAHGDVTLADFPDGSLCVLWHKNYIDGSEDYVNLWGLANEVICAGYIRHDNSTDNLDIGTGEVSFTVTTPEALMDNISLMASISLNAKSTVNKWWKYATWLTAGRAIHHLLKWHSTVLVTCDVLGLTANTQGVKNVDFTEPSLYQMINNLAYSKGIGAKMVSSRLGRLHLVADSQLLNTSGRAALDTIFSITTADISQDFTITRQPEGNLALGHLDGFSFDGSTSSPFVSLIPGYRESNVAFSVAAKRGAGTSKWSGQILTDQDDANERLGRFFAVGNNQWQDLRNSLPRNYLGAFDIVCSLGWYEIGFANSVLKRELEVNGLKTICRHIDAEINTAAGSIGIGVVLEVEAEGEGAITGNYPTTIPDAVEPDAPEWEPPAPGCDTLALGTAADFSQANDDISIVTQVALSETQTLVVYGNVSDSNLEAVVLDISGSTITPGTAAIIDTDRPFAIGLAMLTSTTALCAWQDGTANGKAVVLTVTGSSVSAGTPANFTANDVSSSCLSCAALSATKVFVAYGDAGNSHNLYGVVLDISGTTVTPATPAVINATPITDDSSTGGVAVVALTSASCLVAYKDTSDTFLYGNVIHTITTTFSVGTAVLIDDSDGTIHEYIINFMTGLTSSLVAIIYTLVTGGDEVAVARTLSVSGTSFTANTKLILSSTTGDSDQATGICALTSSRVIIHFHNAGSGDAELLTLTVDGTDLASDGNTITHIYTDVATEDTKGYAPNFTLTRLTDSKAVFVNGSGDVDLDGSPDGVAVVVSCS